MPLLRVRTTAVTMATTAATIWALTARWALTTDIPLRPTGLIGILVPSPGAEVIGVLGVNGPPVMPGATGVAGVTAGNLASNQ